MWQRELLSLSVCDFGERGLSKFGRVKFSGPEKLKITISARGMNVTSGGAKEYIRRLIGNLPNQDCSNKYYVFYDTKKFLGTATSDNIEEVVIDFRTEFLGSLLHRFIWDHLLLPIYLWKYRIDIAIFPKNVIPLFSPCKTVVSALDMGFFFSGLNAYTWFESLYMRLMIPRSFRQADAILSISQATRDEILRLFKGVNPEKIFITYLAGVYVSEERVAGIRDKYGLGGEPYIFFAGSLSPRKNVQRSLRALAKIKNSIPHNFVVTGGKSWKDGDIPDLVKELGLEDRIIKLGFVPDEDMPGLYQNAELYLFPSLYEGFGIPLLEAFSAGVPVITSNLSSLAEIAGDAAITVDPYSIDEIADAILRLAKSDELRVSLARSGKERAKEFSWGKCAKESSKAIGDIINK